MIHFNSRYFGVLQSRKNWENDVLRVRVEACDCNEDPLGYRAVFELNPDSKGNGANDTGFAIGASHLSQRESNLRKSGYMAPMTHKAIALIESKIGSRLAAAA